MCGNGYPRTLSQILQVSVFGLSYLVRQCISCGVSITKNFSSMPLLHLQRSFIIFAWCFKLNSQAMTLLTHVFLLPASLEPQFSGTFLLKDLSRLIVMAWCWLQKRLFVGGLIRDSSSFFVDNLGSFPIIVVEIWAIYYSLFLAWHKGFHHVLWSLILLVLLSYLEGLHRVPSLYFCY